MTGSDHHTSLSDYIRARMAELDIPSVNQLGARAGVAHETVRRILNGQGHPSEATLAKLAAALHTSVPQLRLLAGRPPGEPEPFILPPEANQLTERERNIVRSLVRALLENSNRDYITAQTGKTGQTHSAPRLVGRLHDTDGLA